MKQIKTKRKKLNRQMKPIKDVATQLDIKVQSVEYHMKKLNASYKYVGNKRYIDNTTIDLIKERMNIPTDDVTDSTTEQQTTTDKEHTDTTDNATSSHTTNTDQHTTDNTDNATVNRLLDIIAEQQRTIDKLSSKQSQALINAQVIQREQLGADTTDDADTGATDSDSGTVTHRHTDKSEDAQRGYNKGTDIPEDNGSKEAVHTNTGTVQHDNGKRGIWSRMSRIFGGK